MDVVPGRDFVPEAYADLIEDFLTRREALVIPNRETALFP